MQHVNYGWCDAGVVASSPPLYTHRGPRVQGAPYCGGSPQGKAEPGDSDLCIHPFGWVQKGLNKTEGVLSQRFCVWCSEERKPEQGSNTEGGSASHTCTCTWIGESSPTPFLLPVGVQNFKDSSCPVLTQQYFFRNLCLLGCRDIRTPISRHMFSCRDTCNSSCFRAHSLLTPLLHHSEAASFCGPALFQPPSPSPLILECSHHRGSALPSSLLL